MTFLFGGVRVFCHVKWVPRLRLGNTELVYCPVWHHIMQTWVNKYSMQEALNTNGTSNTFTHDNALFSPFTHAVITLLKDVSCTFRIFHYWGFICLVCSALLDGIWRNYCHPIDPLTRLVSSTWWRHTESPDLHHLLHVWNLHFAASYFWRQVSETKEYILCHQWHFHCKECAHCILLGITKNKATCCVVDLTRLSHKSEWLDCYLYRTK